MRLRRRDGGPSDIGPDALYRIGSISKTQTAALILGFVQEGALRLDETIARFALGLPGDERITVRQLLNHTSGLYNYTDDPEFPRHHDWTPRQRLAVAPRMRTISSLARVGTIRTRTTSRSV